MILYLICGILNLICKKGDCRILSHKRKHSKKPLSRKQKIISRSILAVLVLALGFCSYQIGRKLYDYHTSNTYFANTTKEAVVENTGNLLQDKEDTQPIQDKDKLIGIDWEQFKDTDIAAWVQLDDISYPVYHDDGSMWYLRHLPDGTYATAGSIFLYGNNSPEFTDQSSFIYGHNMINGSMFGKLKNYAKDEYKNHKFYLYLPDGTRHTYQFFSVGTVNSSSKAYTWSFGSEQSFQDWQEYMKSKSHIGCEAPIDTSKRYVTLSTCNGHGSESRLIICGQEIAVDNVQEPASWYGEYKAKLDANKQKAKDAIQARSETIDKLHQDAEQALYENRRKQ